MTSDLILCCAGLACLNFPCACNLANGYTIVE
jgi:hypothetical protein